MRDPDEARKKFECKFLNQQSKFLSSEDQRHNAPPTPFFRRKRDEVQHPTSAAFERRMNGS